MNTFNDLYEFIELAKNNRKYPTSMANNLRSALKIFEKELNQHELDSIKVLERNLDEIFNNVISKNKDKTITSLNTYKIRFLKTLNDYKRYGTDPSKIQTWEAKHRPSITRQTEQSTVLLKSLDKQDKNKINLSKNIPHPVETVENSPANHHKIELALKSGKITLLIPNNISTEEIKTIKAILDTLNFK